MVVFFMLIEKQIIELQEHFEKAQNPVFFYDNDVDGLCSFVLLRRYLGRGKGVAVRSHPDIDVRYAKKAQELQADYIFVLDRPFLGDAFVQELERLNLPIVWIDHHEVDSKHHRHSQVHVFNPTLHTGEEKSAEPVTYLCYSLTNRKEDLWFAILGCISDHYLPDFSSDFVKQYPELWGGTREIREPFDAYYTTEIGMLARALSFGLKDSITHVVYLQNFLIACRSPHDLLEELISNSSFTHTYQDTKKKYDELLHRAREHVGKKMVYFEYGGTVSMSADLANELSYLYPKQVIIVAYDKGLMSNLSLRGKRVRSILELILPGFEGASGGGHEDAVGARLRTADLERFKEAFE